MAFTIYKNPDSPIRGILFDMDGLVLDTEILYSRFWREAARELGYTMTWEQSLGMRALNAEASQALLNSYYGPGISYQELRAIRIRRMDAYIAGHGVQPKPGVRELLSWLQQEQIPAALASSSPLERIRSHMGPLQLLDDFQAVCSGYEVPHGKPAPDIFLYAADRLGLAPENCMVLEDSPAGILAARRAGCFPVMIPDLDQPDEKTLGMLGGRADSLADIIGMLKAI